MSTSSQNVFTESTVVELRCVLCDRSYRPEEVRYVCPACGPLGVLDVRYDDELLRRRVSRLMVSGSTDWSMWRYRPLLPLAPDTPVGPLQVGWTPLYRAERLRSALGLANLYLKDDTRNPTASLKDRASAVGIAKALELGAREVACASTGNAASSWAGAAASLGLTSYIFVPQRAPRAKVAQLLAFGATVFSVQGSYDDAFDLCIVACERFGWYNRNTGYNPYLLEGKKTVALEIAEQLGWQAPDKVIVPVGDGCIIGGVAKGFADLQRLGWIDHRPQLIAVQAEGSAAIARALASDGQVRPVEDQTIADSISVGLPRNGAMAVREIRASGGSAVVVSDEEILAAIPELARLTAVFAEPAGAASYAGLKKLISQGQIRWDETVVLLVTGSGLKDVESARRATGSPHPVEPGDLVEIGRLVG